MAKKTVLKKCLKYAPLKSDFVRGIVQDETIKAQISEDMYEVPNVVVEDADYTIVDTDSGEILEDADDGNTQS